MNELSRLARDTADATSRIAEAIGVHAVRTPLAEWAAIGDSVSSTLLVKSEHRQRTGSFKLRGALAKVLSLSDAERERGIVTASTGNHGLGVAQALRSLGGSGIICVPENASGAKVAALARYDVDVRTLGREAGETEDLARAMADELGLTYVSPYNDPAVIAGQGTVGREILAQIGDRRLDAVVVAVGGGGLISGVAATIKAAMPHVSIIGASPANDAAMAASVAAGRIVDIDALPTISDGTAGGIEPQTITLPLCQELVDEWVLVSEDEVYRALERVIDTEHELIEGAAATAIAAAIRTGHADPGRTIVAVSCGANISSATLRTALNG